VIVFRTRGKWRRTRRPGWRAAWWALLAAFTLVLTVAFLERGLRPAVWAVAETRAFALANAAINTAMAGIVSPGLDYNDLIRVEHDDQGRVAMLRPDTAAISRLAAQATLAIQQQLKSAGPERFGIPLGQALGSSIFAGLGPAIPVTVYPMGTVSTRVADRFEGAGINQTRHVIYLEAVATMRVVAPLLGRLVVVSSQVPLVDVVIVGEVPFGYVQFQWPPGSGQSSPGSGENPPGTP
jgi:sporulation protein YunB